MKNPPRIDPDRAAAVLCQRKLSRFVREFWHVIAEDELEWAPHMDVLCDEVQAVYERVFLRPDPEEPKRMIRLAKLYDLIINVPPGTTKSTIVTVMAPAWSWTRDASLRHITLSYSSELSTEHAVMSRDIIRSAKFKRYYPDVIFKSDQDNKTNYKTTRKGQRFSTSITGTITGKHAHIITADDPLNPKQAASQVELLEANTFFDKTLPTRKANKKVTPMILVMQRLAMNDPTGHLLEKRPNSIRHICLPGELASNVTPEYRRIYVDGMLDPNRLGKTELAELRLDLGGAGFSGQIQQAPAPEDGLIWMKTWFKIVDDIMFPREDDAEQFGTDWDLAYTSEEENAASAYVTSGRIKGGSHAPGIYIFDVGFDWLEFPALIRWMKSRKRPHYIEAKASGKSAKQTLTNAGIPAIEVDVKGGSDKVARARSATPLAEAGMVYVKKSLVEALFHDPKQGILNFPRGKYKDLADAFAQALQRHFTAPVRSLLNEHGEYDDREDKDPLDNGETDIERYDDFEDLLGSLGYDE